MLAAVLLVPVVTSCGPDAPRDLSVPSSTSPAASAAPALLVTDVATGTTVTLRPGKHLRVRLSGTTYDSPVSSNPASVVRRRSAGGYPDKGPVEADFQAQSRGAADLSATSDAACLRGQPRCLMLQRQWFVHVVVR